MTSLEEAIYAAAYIDAMRSIFDDRPLEERVKMAKREAILMVELHRKYG